jgi:predicted dehydrogenase
VTRSVGIVGAGNMAKVHAEGWRAIGANVTAVVGRNGSRTAAFADSIGATVATTVDEIASRIDVIDICSPTDTHLGYITDSAKLGLPIVCEKPLARTGSDAREAVAICSAAGVPLLPAHVVRFFPEYLEMKRRVDAGDIGDVAVVRLNRSAYLPAGASGWFRDQTRSGGVVLDLMIHDIDYSAWIAGPVVRAYARSGSAGGGEHVLATLRHTGGAISHIQGSWAFPSGTFMTSLEVAGSRGAIDPLPTTATTTALDRTSEVRDIPEPPMSGESPYVAQLRHFASVLDGETVAIVTPEEAADAVAVCDAVAASIATGLSVDVETRP